MNTGSKPAPECRLRVAVAFAVATALGEFAALLVLGDFYSRMLLARIGQASSPLVELSVLATAAITAVWAYALADRMKLCQRRKPGRAAVLKTALTVAALSQVTYATAVAADIAFHDAHDWFAGLLLTRMFLGEWITWSLMGLIYYGGFAFSANVAAGLALSRR